MRVFFLQGSLDVRIKGVKWSFGTGLLVVFK